MGYMFGPRTLKHFAFCSVASFRTVSLKAMSKEAEFYISLPDKPVYLRSWDNKKTDIRSTLAMQRFKTLFIIIIDPESPQNSVQSEEDADRETTYVRSCISVQGLFRALVEKDNFNLSKIDFVLGAKTFRTTRSSVERQLYAFVSEDLSEGQSRPMHAILENAGAVNLWMYNKTETSESSVVWKLSDVRKNGTVSSIISMPEMLIECGSVSEVSPIFQENCFSPVFHDYERSLKVLHMYKECPEVKQLLSISSKELTEQKSLPELEAMMKHPLVVVEGMDAAGKTTLTEYLEKKLEAVRYSTPPPCLLPLRRFFDKLPEIVRRAYYSLGNYIVSQQIATECQTRAVVMDRFWHSTAAYGIANETSFEDLPPPGHSDYLWPEDLLKPTAVIFLHVTEQVRRERLGNRSENSITFEEKSLNKDQMFRKRLCEAYLRMSKPACVPVDACGTKEEVVQAVLEQLRQQGIDLHQC